ncbi:MFS transporter [Lysinibacillus yapensis]|uniref:MFS transporter n=1 Tax=Ureibacillus yapensis TaxID=2304605 RepID=A0A396S5I7_9BACL|nr:MFS transporter [Lysinibacillus yapensis]RHW34755.1 MFS transporter [Lysinibacillus yapensis]
MIAATHYEQRRFWILVAIVSISGFSQGMLLPLISVIFESDGVSSTLNGLNATGLYIGTLLISPFIEKPLRKFGYKPIIIVGGAIVFIALFLFPFWHNVMFWFILRMMIGIGDHCLHYSTQTWLTSTAPAGNIGKTMSIYGLSFGVGFAVGPLMVNLVKISETLPFIVSSILCLIAWSFVFVVRNEKPESLIGDSKESNSFHRYKMSFKYAWVAFIPPLVYGVLETSLNALFPVYALRKDFDVSMVSIILAAFSIGGILTQVPIGMLGDKIGRRKIILAAFLAGTVFFGVGSMFEHSEWIIACVFLLAGMALGSMFSLGITYMAELTPKALLPTANLLYGIFFSLGSLIGPTAGGLYLQYVESLSFLLFISFILLVMLLVVFFFGKQVKEA